ncbi:TIGR04141 family sporadically distributed protein [Acinetobacter bereziniae]|nr:TIGR04141 family sporadically distributed protein [Acinetobacter bereziniae]
METEKKRKEKLSIYLARDGQKEDSHLIKLENTQSPIRIDLPNIDSAILYIKKYSPKITPPWTKLFTDNGLVPSSEFGFSSNVGAILIIRMLDSTFILTFGTGFHLLRLEAIERDFGLKVTLNSVDPDKLRSLDKASYDLNPLNSRTQSTLDVDIFNLHLDSEMEMLYAITGVSIVNEFGSQVTGRDALTIAVETNLEDIPRILKESIKRYKMNLPNKFSWVENIHRVRDLDEIEILDLELDVYLSSNKHENFWLGEPEIIDWENQIGYSFDMRQKTPRFIVLSFKDFLEYLNDNIPTVEIMKNTTIHVNNNEYQSIKKWSV